jgi:CysZ protein
VAERAVPGLRDGLFAVPRAVVFLLRHHEARQAAFLPGAIHAVVLLAFGILGVVAMDDVTTRLVPSLPDEPAASLLAQVRHIAAVIALSLATVLLALLGGVAVVLVLAGPLLERLAAIVEAQEGVVTVEPPLSLRGVLSDVGRATMSMVQVLSLALLVQAPLVVASMVPGLNLVATPLLLLWTAFFFGFAASEPHLDRQRLSFVQKLRLAHSRWPAILGLGAVISLLALVPVLNLLLGPVHVTAATRLWLGRPGKGP